MPFLAILGVDVALEHTGHGAPGFRSIWQGLNGFQLYSDPVNEGLLFVSVNLPSKCLQSVGMDNLRLGWEWLCESGFRFQTTRCDPAFDTQNFEVQQFVDAYFEGLVSTRSRAWDDRKSSEGGHTFYVGSRESLAYLRVYHKVDGSSFGDEAFTRVELEMKGIRADIFMLEMMAADPSEWARIAVRSLNGFLQVDAPWWAAFVGTVERSWLKLRQKVSTVASIGTWLRRQVAPALAVYVQAVSQGEIDVLVKEINALLEDGQRRFTKRHEQLIRGNSGDGMPEFAVYAW